MLPLRSPLSFDDRIWICALAPDAHPFAAPTGYALLRETPELAEAVADAFDRLDRDDGRPLQIPLSIPVVAAARFRNAGALPIAHIHALKAAVEVLGLELGEHGSRPASLKTAEAFERMAPAPRARNAVLEISQRHAPRLRVRRTDCTWVSAALPDLRPPSWARPPRVRLGHVAHA